MGTNRMNGPPDFQPGAGAGPLPGEVDPFRALMESRTGAGDADRVPHAEPAEAGPALAEQAEGNAPVGQGDYVVRPGECIASIAKETGHLWESIWNDPGNAQLRAIRQDPNVLLPGDRVCLPSKGGKKESGATEMRHRFRRKGEPGFLRLVVRELGEPRGNVAYTLKVDGRELSGFTDAEGRLEQPIPSDAKTATLILIEGEDQDEFELNLGDLDPLDSVSGVQARLNNLGYAAGPIDGIIGPRTTAAVERFCGDHELETPPPGQIGRAVREKLREVHGF